MIYKVDQCMAVFDPATAKVDGAPLRCRDGTDAGPTCLSDIELTALKKINQRHRLPYALEIGRSSCSARWCQNVWISVFAVAFIKKHQYNPQYQHPQTNN